MYDETVHNSKLEERLAFEESINLSATMSLLKEVMELTMTLSNLTQALMGPLEVEVMENNQSR